MAKDDLQYINSSIELAPSFKEKLKLIWSHKTALLGLVLSIVAVIIATDQVQKYQSLKTNAATSPAEIFFNPSADSVTTTEKTFPVWINSSAVSVGFASIELTFDPSKIILTKEITLNSALTNIPLGASQPPLTVTTMAAANATGKINLTLGLPPSTTASPSPRSPLAPSGTFQVATMTLKAINSTTGSSSVTVNTSNSQLVAMDASVFGLSSTPLALTLNPVVTTSGASLSFSTPTPVNPQVVGTPFTTDMIMNTASNDTYGVDTIVRYDATKLTLNSITPTAGNGFSSYPLSNIDNTAGVAKFSANIGSAVNAAAVNGNNVSIAKLIFTPLVATTSVDLVYEFAAGNRNDSNIIFKNASASQDPIDILTTVTPLSIVANLPIVSPSPSPSASPSLNPSPSPDPTASNVTFTFSFQGKTRAGVNRGIPITFSYKTVGQVTPTTRNLTTNAEGQVIVSLLPGNYSFLVRARGYLARRFASSTAPISIGPGITAIDFTNSPMLGGDLNEDGVVNEVDYTLKFIHPTIFGSADFWADLDNSGQVNTLDFGIMRSNWNLANDTFQ